MTSTKTLSILIVEDEIIIAESLKAMLSNLGVSFISVANNLSEFKDSISSKKIDLVFLDINLSTELEGIELAEECNQKEIPFAFLTSYSDKETIRKAMSVQPVAYLNKPFNELEIFKTLELVKGRGAEDSVLKIKDGHDLVHIKFKDIKWLKAENVYTQIQTNSKKYLYRASLKDMLSNLPEDQFFKTHRSYVVNVNKVERVSADSVVVDGDSIPLSRSQKSILNDRLA